MKNLGFRSILAVFIGCIAAQAHALDSQWYVGIGGGSSYLVPNPVNSAVDDEENVGAYGTFIAGRDLGRLTSFQVQLHSLGTVELTNQQEATYNAADASLLYRFYDSRDRGLNPDGFGVSFYGRFGLGGIRRESPANLPLKNDTAIFFTGGAGFEVYLTRNLAVRIEGAYLDQDALYGGFSLIGRFGGAKARRSPTPPKQPSRRPAEPPQTTETPAIQPTTPMPVVPTPDATATPVPVPNSPTQNPRATSSNDLDGDGVINAQDSCGDSVPAYPVKSNGCAVFNGVLSGVKFSTGGASLMPESFKQLDSLISLLKAYPKSRIQIVAHTDNAGTVAEQSGRTRSRLRTIGTYLVRGGVSANRLILRSLGGSRPAYDNTTAGGRAKNNRIELLEYR